MTDFLTPIASANDTVESIKPKLKDIESRIRAVLGQAEPVKADLKPELVSETECCRYIRRKITFAVEKGERIPAYLLIPKTLAKPVPAILCLHGTSYNGKENTVALAPELPGRNYGHELAEAGYVTFAIDDPAMGERNPLGKSYDTGHFYKRYPNWSIVGKMIWDYGRAIDYLSTLDFVDSSRLGGIGHSLGATTLLFLAALEPRLKVSVASCGWSSLHPRQPRLNVFANPDHGYIRLMKLKELSLAGKNSPFDFHELIALIAPRALLRISGYNDPITEWPEIIAESSFKASAVYRLMNCEKRFAQYFHGDGHDLTRTTRTLAYTWLEEQFKETEK